MKTRETIKKEASQISDQDRKNFESLIEEIKMILSHKVINEETLTKLTNIMTDVRSIKENYMWRIIRAAKQNHMLD
jgi:molecular chaperone DnaK (HSP70)